MGICGLYYLSITKEEAENVLGFSLAIFSGIMCAVFMIKTVLVYAKAMKKKMQKTKERIS